MPGSIDLTELLSPPPHLFSIASSCSVVGSFPEVDIVILSGKSTVVLQDQP